MTIETFEKIIFKIKLLIYIVCTLAWLVFTILALTLKLYNLNIIAITVAVTDLVVQVIISAYWEYHKKKLEDKDEK